MNNSLRESYILQLSLFAWEQRKFEDVTFLSGEKNKNNLPFESYSVTNENGFVPLLGTGENRQKVSSENRHF